MNSLTFEQCKKLKELGYPQDTGFRWIKEADTLLPKSILHSIDQTYYACPNLEELLEWVVGGRTDFRLYTDFIDKDYGDKGFVWRCGFTEVTQPYMLHHSLVCKTPLEAACELAIAIHKYDPLPHVDSEGQF